MSRQTPSELAQEVYQEPDGFPMVRSQKPVDDVDFPFFKQVCWSFYIRENTNL